MVRKKKRLVEGDCVLVAIKAITQGAAACWLMKSLQQRLHQEQVTGRRQLKVERAARD